MFLCLPSHVEPASNQADLSRISFSFVPNCQHEIQIHIRGRLGSSDGLLTFLWSRFFSLLSFSRTLFGFAGGVSHSQYRHSGCTFFLPSGWTALSSGGRVSICFRSLILPRLWHSQLRQSLCCSSVGTTILTPFRCCVRGLSWPIAHLAFGYIRTDTWSNRFFTRHYLDTHWRIGGWCSGEVDGEFCSLQPHRIWLLLWGSATAETQGSIRLFGKYFFSVLSAKRLIIIDDFVWC